MSPLGRDVLLDKVHAAGVLFDSIGLDTLGLSNFLYQAINFRNPEIIAVFEAFLLTLELEFVQRLDKGVKLVRC